MDKWSQASKVKCGIFFPAESEAKLIRDKKEGGQESRRDVLGKGEGNQGRRKRKIGSRQERVRTIKVCCLHTLICERIILRNSYALIKYF